MRAVDSPHAGSLRRVPAIVRARQECAAADSTQSQRASCARARRPAPARQSPASRSGSPASLSRADPSANVPADTDVTPSAVSAATESQRRPRVARQHDPPDQLDRQAALPHEVVVELLEVEVLAAGLLRSRPRGACRSAACRACNRGTSGCTCRGGSPGSHLRFDEALVDEELSPSSTVHPAVCSLMPTTYRQSRSSASFSCASRNFGSPSP